jgi:predicted permease
LSAGVALVFLVLCANVANLILARTNVRRVEFGVASALGASRWRLLRQVFFENAAIGLLAAVAGLALAWVLTGLVLSIIPASMATRTLNAMGVDFRAVGIASVLGLLATIFAGLPPAWIGTRVDPASSLRLSSRGATDSRESRRWTRALLVGEVALASMLLVGAGLLTTSFVRLMQIEPGIDTRAVMTAWASLPSFNFKARADVAAAAENLRSHMAAMPGISAASLSFGMPPGGGSLHFDSLKTDDGRTVPDMITSSQALGPDAFEVFGIKIIEGRSFQGGGAQDEVILGRGLAATLWPEQSAVGHSFSIGQTSYRVIGVAREVRSSLNDPGVDTPEFYERFQPGSRQVMLGMRCAAACPSTEAVRTWLRSAGAGFFIADVSSLEHKYNAQFDKPRAAATLALIFAALALFASAGGLFSVLTYAVGQRRREFGVRVALGARPVQLQVIVVRDSLVVAATGLFIGASAVWLVSRWMSSLITGVSAASPLVWLSVVTTLILSTIAAAWRPARSASKADPIALLREN